MKTIEGTIIDHNAGDSYYIVWLLDENKKIHEILIPKGDGLSHQSVSTEPISHFLFRKIILENLREQRARSFTGMPFSSDHINPNTQQQNLGLSLLENGGFYTERTGDVVVQFRPPLFNVHLPVIEKLEVTLNSVNRRQNLMILRLSVNDRIAASLQVSVDGKIVKTEIGCSSDTDDEVFTLITVPKGSKVMIEGNKTPNGFYKTVLFDGELF